MWRFRILQDCHKSQVRIFLTSLFDGTANPSNHFEGSANSQLEESVSFDEEGNIADWKDEFWSDHLQNVSQELNKICEKSICRVYYTQCIHDGVLHFFIHEFSVDMYNRIFFATKAFL